MPNECVREADDNAPPWSEISNLLQPRKTVVRNPSWMVNDFGRSMALAVDDLGVR